VTRRRAWRLTSLVQWLPMKAVRYHGPGQPFRLEEVDRREPQAGEVLVRVAASGICHTELHFKSGLLDLGVAPVTMGHEVVGRIEAVGEGVSPDRADERVIVYYYLGYLECAYCRNAEVVTCWIYCCRHGGQRFA
jgi:propanol-preferring alcohol dehydrogenase